MMPAWAAIVPELVPPTSCRPPSRSTASPSTCRARSDRRSRVFSWRPWARGSSSCSTPSRTSVFSRSLLRWRREHDKSTLPAERFLSAIRVGMRFVTHTRALQIVLIRGSAFFIFASATWSLVSPHRAARAAARPGDLWPAAHVHRHRRGCRRRCCCRACARRSRATSLVAGASALYALAALALAHLQNIRAARGGDARDRRRVDLDSFRAAGLRANDAARVGARPRTRRIRRRVHGRNGASAASCGDRSRHGSASPAALTVAALGNGCRDRARPGDSSSAITRCSISRRRWIGRCRSWPRPRSPIAVRSW